MLTGSVNVDRPTDAFFTRSLLLEATLWNFLNPNLHQYAMVTFSLTALLTIGIRFK